MDEAKLEDSGSGLAPTGDGWFVVNVRDARWWTSDTRGFHSAPGTEHIFVGAGDGQRRNRNAE